MLEGARSSGEKATHLRARRYSEAICFMTFNRPQRSIAKKTPNTQHSPHYPFIIRDRATQPASLVDVDRQGA